MHLKVVPINTVPHIVQPQALRVPVGVVARGAVVGAVEAVLVVRELVAAVLQRELVQPELLLLHLSAHDHEQLLFFAL